jgi:hypothetical protein
MLPKNKRKIYSVLISLLMSACITANFSACNKENDKVTPVGNTTLATATTTAPKSPEKNPKTDATTTTSAKTEKTSEKTSEKAEQTPPETTPKTPATKPSATQKTSPPETQAPAKTTAKPTPTVKTTPPETQPPAQKDTDAENIQNLYNNKQSDVWVHGKGTVTRILPDDTDGDKHQKFILELSTGQTLLVAHNIDIAPRIADIQVGDTISFYGEYIYSEQGGTLHWTHHDPDGSSEGGYLEKNGVFFK